MDYKPEDTVVLVNGEEVVGFSGDEIVQIDRGLSATGTKENKQSIIFSVHYDVIGAGPVGHPQKVFARICQMQGWEVLESTPHTIGDCWIFKVESKNGKGAYLPSYIKVLEEKKN